MVQEKEIVKKRDIVFKPDHMPDPKPFHPAVIILRETSNKNEAYYLTATSNVLRYVCDADERLTQYYLLMRSGLPKTSLINLDYIYKSSKLNDSRMTVLDTPTYRNIIEDLKKRQEFLASTSRGADEFYDEIKDCLKHC